MKNLILILSALLVLSSCTTISYSPKVSLDVSPRTINKSVQVEKFKDLSPQEDTENPLFGLSVTNTEALSNSLDLEVTNAIVTDFAINGVFRQISRKVENPDLIIKGEIRKFTGISELNTHAKFSFLLALAGPIAGLIYTSSGGSYTHSGSETFAEIMLICEIPLLSGYFGIPIRSNYSEVEIVLYLYDNKNTLIGSYTGKSSDERSASMYRDIHLAVPNMTNKVFSEAVMQIREQLMNELKIKN